MKKYKRFIMFSALTLLLLGTVMLCGGGGTNGAVFVGISSLM